MTCTALCVCSLWQDPCVCVRSGQLEGRGAWGVGGEVGEGRGSASLIALSLLGVNTPIPLWGSDLECVLCCMCVFAYHVGCVG